MKFIIRFFDKLEDKVRGWLSHRPILYGFLAGVGTVLFWRGVWHTTDYFSSILFVWRGGSGTIDLAEFPDGPLSLLIGIILLLVTGVFVSGFIGNEIIISGLRGEKKLAEKTDAEVKTETGAIAEIRQEVGKIRERLEEMDKRPGNRN